MFQLEAPSRDFSYRGRNPANLVRVYRMEAVALGITNIRLTENLSELCASFPGLMVAIDWRGPPGSITPWKKADP